MKRFFSAMVLAVLFAGCDDGDLTEVSFDFNESSAEACNTATSKFFLFKTTDQRALILQLSERNFSNTITQDTLNGAPIQLTINDPATNQLIYRVYNGNVSSSVLCTAVTPSFPTVVEERVAAGGKITIETTAIKTDVGENGSNAITHYQHTLTFSDITFNLGEGNQRNESLPPVIYRRAAPSFAAFDLTTPLNRCGENNNLLYRFNSNLPANSQAMKLELSDAAVEVLFSDVLDVPKTQYLSNEEGEVNRLTHVFFGSTLTNPLGTDYFCATTTPNFPAVKDVWTAQEGAAIEVVTTQVDSNVKRHTVTLKGVRMRKGSQDFFLKTNFVFGSFDVTTAP